MAIKLSDHFSYGRLLRFVLPSVIMMVFTSVYTVVDGLFVSNFAGKTPFAALNLIAPIPMILGSVGFMLGSGGNAIVAKTLGEGDNPRANRYFTMLVITSLVSGIILVAIGMPLMRVMAIKLGADEDMLGYCVTYGRAVLVGLPFFMLQNMFQSFFITAEKPKLGLYVIVAAGLTNVVLDAVLVAWLKLGVGGAAAATVISMLVGGATPLFYFLRENDSLLHFTKTGIEPKILLGASYNGSSELLTNISSSLVTMLYNLRLMQFAGENGVAAYGVIMYVQFVFVAIFIGYSMGSAPIIGFHFGAENKEELKNIFRKSLVLILVSGISLVALANLLAPVLAGIFVGYDDALMELTVHGFRIFSLSYLLCGFSIFGSAFFTALSNGTISAVISFLRSIVFECASVMILPLIFGLDGIWCAIIVAEVFSAAATFTFFGLKGKKYMDY